MTEETQQRGFIYDIALLPDNTSLEDICKEAEDTGYVSIKDLEGNVIKVKITPLP